MATEETDHFCGLTDHQHEDDIYNRFSKSEKRVILVVVSIAGFVGLFVGSSFVPSIPEIAQDLNLSGAVVSLAFSLSVFANALGGLVLSAYSSFYGRRPMFLCGMPLMAIGSFGTAYSRDLSNLLFWRFIQSFGCIGGMYIGPAVIGDVYRLEERGTAMGRFYGAAFFGLAAAPLVGGTTAQYWSWRGFQMSLGIWALFQMIFIYALLPETAHPNSRGVDKMKKGSGWVQLWVNPFSSLALLRSPVLITVTLGNTFALMTDYALLVPIAYTMGARYNIASETLIGACFLPSGIGNFVGAVVAGRLSDKMVKKWKNERNGVWYPEDRLRAVYIGALYLVPLSVSIAGLTMTYIDGKTGLIICLICLLTNGAGVDMVLTPISAYTVDLMGSRSAEAVAALSALRSLLLTPLSALIIPSIDVIGVAATNGLAALLAVMGYMLVWLTIRYGDRMRTYVDVGYVTEGDDTIRLDEMTLCPE